MNLSIKKILFKNVLWIIAIVLAIIFLIIEQDRTGDFEIYYNAAADLFKGKNIYKNIYNDLFHYPGSPFLALIISPLSLIPFKFAALIFKAFNLFILLRIWKLLEQYFNLNLIEKKQRNTFIVAAFLCIIFPIYSNFHSIQFTFILLYCMLEGLNQINKNNSFFGAALIVLGIFIKISPIIILPYLIYRNHFKSAIYTIVLIPVAFIIVALFIGWDYNILLWSDWMNLINPKIGETIYDLSNRTNSGIGALLSSLLIPGLKNPHNSLSIRRHIFNIDPETVILLTQIIRLIFVSFMLFFLKTKPFKKAHNKLHELWEISYLLMLIPIIFPEQRPYNFIFLMPAISYILFSFLIRPKEKRKTNFLTLFFFTGVLILNLELLLGSYREYYWYYKTITYGAFIILITLCLLPPKTILKKIKLKEH